MKKQISNPVCVQDVVDARQVAEDHPFTRSAQQLVARLSAGLLCLLLMPNLGAADPRRTSDPIDPPSPQRPLSSLSVSDVTMPEGNEGAAVLRFKVNLLPASAEQIALSYRVVDGSARCGDGDYQAASGSVTIPAYTSSTEIPVTVYGDKVRESDESFLLIVSDATNAQIIKGMARGTISNDDFDGGGGGPRRLPVESEGHPRILPDPIGPPATQPPFVSLSISDKVMPEGNGGTSVLEFTVHVTPESATPITLSYQLMDRTARCADSDYQGAHGTVTIPANMSSSLIGVTVFGDQVRESDETFVLLASDAINAQIVDGVATGTISNDDFIGGGGGDPRRMPEGAAPVMAKASFSLAGANPVRGRPSFQFSLPRPSHVSLAIYDMAGRMVGAPVEGFFQAGAHFQAWNQSKPAPGIYLARFRGDDQVVTQRISWLD